MSTPSSHGRDTDSKFDLGDHTRSENGDNPRRSRRTKGSGNGDEENLSRKEQAIRDMASGKRSMPSALKPAEPQLVQMSDVHAIVIDWLWLGHLPRGKVMVLDGDPDVGKSLVTIDFTAIVSTGSKWPDGAPCQLGKVLIMSAEDDPDDTIRPRLDAAEADSNNVLFLNEVIDPITGRPRQPSLPGDLAVIEKVVRDNGVTLLIIDVLAAYLDPDVKIFNDQSVRAALAHFHRMAAATGCCIIVLRHVKKGEVRKAIHAGGGSIGLIGAARAGFMAALDPDDEEKTRRVLVCTKMNLAPKPPAQLYKIVGSENGAPAIQWLGASKHTADDLVDPDNASDDGDAANWLRSYFEDRKWNDADATDIYAAGRKDGYSSDQLKRAKHKIGVVARKPHFHGGWVWGRKGAAEGSDTRTMHSSHSSPAPESVNLYEAPLGGFY